MASVGNPDNAIVFLLCLELPCFLLQLLLLLARFLIIVVLVFSGFLTGVDGAISKAGPIGGKVVVYNSILLQ